MRISQLAERAGVPASTLRYYEDAGLLAAVRTPAGYRDYGEDAVERLEFIGAGKRLGLSLEEIAAVLPLWEDGTCAQVRAALRPRVEARIADTAQRSARLESFAAFLHAALDHLDSLPDRAVRCDADCKLPEPSSADVLMTGSAPAGLAREDTSGEGERWRHAPVACTLGADDMIARVAAWHEALDGARGVAIPEGVRLTLPVSRTRAVASLAAAEQDCCPFFDFRLHLDGPELHMEVRAPKVAAATLATLFARPANTPIRVTQVRVH